ncbi:hypothetical protein SS50377_26453 [Spironucleus salmonicida]|uniref:Uncharacterized protein n=1 Tax=Spironucleus salmonicida TaxID=348837 RepID=V6LAR4_9EUKA|nr:hypothetical protein SS50377_26453 [Spironucleus salmonicida]|eukprot:EST41313.1 Hypothetical protein SS50377_19025 [Spironucleus salmonicida]
MSDQYVQYLIKDPDTPQDTHDAIALYPTLTSEEQRTWRNQWLPKMHQVAIWNFYWRILRPIEDRDGTEKVAQEIDADIPALELQLREAQQELEDAKQRHQRVVEDRQNKKIGQEAVEDRAQDDTAAAEELNE